MAFTTVQSAQVIDRLVDRRFMLRLHFTETLLGSRPTESIAAKWLEAQDKAKAERDHKRGAAPKLLELAAAPDRAGYYRELIAGARTAAQASGQSLLDIYSMDIPALEDFVSAWDAPGVLEELQAKHSIGETLASAMVEETGEAEPDESGSRLAVTGFSTHDATGRLHLWDFQLMGYLKAAAGALDMKIPGKRADKIGAKTQIQQLAWVFGTDDANALDRRIYLRRGEADGDYITEPDGVFDRPLRAMTPQGERVSIAVSEIVEPPCVATAQLVLLRGCRLEDEQIHELMTYGIFQGLGQWRSGGWGRFMAEVERVK
jgi:hypothetical protein